MNMVYREATVNDIDQMHTVRLAVRENILVNHSLVTSEHYIKLISKNGKGWVCESDSRIVAFAIVDSVKKNVWALFVHPEYEAKGIGKTIHKIMLDWYFSHDDESLWLSTDANTRADHFYRQCGWKELFRFGKNEIKFEMTAQFWRNNSSQIRP